MTDGQTDERTDRGTDLLKVAQRSAYIKQATLTRCNTAVDSATRNVSERVVNTRNKLCKDDVDQKDNVSDYQTNGLYQTPNRNPSPLFR